MLALETANKDITDRYRDLVQRDERKTQYLRTSATNYVHL